MTKEIWYTSRNCFDSEFKVEFSWENYINWSKLTHLSELVSLDGSLNGLVFKPDFKETDWKYIVTEESLITQFFNSINYVLNKSKDLKYFNLLAVVQEPSETKADLANEFDFVGYDLVETNGDISALTNCGGFNESFSPIEQNQFGLITEYERAKKIQKDLRKNNPNEHHADCYLYEVWRHKTIGRKNTS